MIPLLEFLIRYCGELFEGPRFKFRDSETGKNSFEGSSILLESDDVEVFISTERGQLTWQIRSKHDPKPKNWFSFDLVAGLFGERVENAIMDQANSALLHKYLPEIIRRFRPEVAQKTVAMLNSLERARDRRW